MHHVQIGRPQHVAIIGEGLRDAQSGSGRPHPVREIAECGDLNAQPAQGLDVDRADEAGADNAGAKVVERSHCSHGHVSGASANCAVSLRSKAWRQVGPAGRAYQVKTGGVNYP